MGDFNIAPISFAHRRQPEFSAKAPDPAAGGRVYLSVFWPIFIANDGWRDLHASRLNQGAN